MADDISPVNLPPIASTGDAPFHDSARGSNDKKNKNKNKDADKSKDESAGQSSDSGSQPPESREKKSPSSDVEFERTEHELDRFA
jgi:hypothetical protein